MNGGQGDNNDSSKGSTKGLKSGFTRRPDGTIVRTTPNIKLSYEAEQANDSANNTEKGSSCCAAAGI